ncbi:MAG TPA: hypothetical protein DDW52_14750 [Planctomycetaceae bacterium]|nr:hypothetical protein [Planctomycetaceae bacterium]
MLDLTQFPDAVRIDDPNGQLACSLGMATSGVTLLFAPDGEIRFSGGLTFARSHEGRNRGTYAIMAQLKGMPVNYASTPVFGCSIGCNSQADEPAAPNNEGADNVQR